MARHRTRQQPRPWSRASDTPPPKTGSLFPGSPPLRPSCCRCKTLTWCVCMRVCARVHTCVLRATGTSVSRTREARRRAARAGGRSCSLGLSSSSASWPPGNARYSGEGAVPRQVRAAGPPRTWCAPNCCLLLSWRCPEGSQRRGPCDCMREAPAALLPSALRTAARTLIPTTLLPDPCRSEALRPLPFPLPLLTRAQALPITGSLPPPCSCPQPSATPLHSSASVARLAASRHSYRSDSLALLYTSSRSPLERGHRKVRTYLSE